MEPASAPVTRPEGPSWWRPRSEIFYGLEPEPFSKAGAPPFLLAIKPRESTMPLKGKVAIITGGNSGIGQAIVLELARLHANVVIDYVCHPEATDALERQISKLGDQSIGVE